MLKKVYILFGSFKEDPNANADNLFVIGAYYSKDAVESSMAYYRDSSNVQPAYYTEYPLMPREEVTYHFV